MHRFFAPCVFPTALLAAAPGYSQNVATGSVTLPAAGRSDGASRPSSELPPTEAINHDTIHLEKRLSAVRASGNILLDGALDEPAWSTAPIANGFIQNDPREGTAATYDT